MTWETITTFIVPGQPKAKSRPRFSHGHAYTDAATKAAETRVIDAFEMACPLWEPTVEDVQLHVDIHFSGKRRADGDNCYKLATDALNQYAYEDDRQITDGHFTIHEHAGDRAGLVITFAIRKEP